MTQFLDTNYLWFAPIFSFIVAQLMKYVVYAVQYKVLRKERLTGAGGMPSSHSSGVCTLMVVMGFSQGTDSAVFAVSVIFGLVVMYDAAGVRRAAGLHAKVINMLKQSIDELDPKKNIGDDNTGVMNDKPQKELKEFVGHTPLEVFCGAVVGVLIGIMFVI
jgi:hypothetical protein